MRVTPLEIRQKTFEKGFRGYEKEEVDAYLLTLSVEWEKVLDDMRELKARVEAQEKDLVKMREVENSLYKTLKTAETTGSTMVEQANKSAELILKEAQINAEAVLNDAKYNAKNMLEEAEVRAKNAEEEAKDHVRIASRELKEIENQKDNLLMELKNIANDTLERVNKINSKNKKTSDNQPIKNQEEQALPLPRTEAGEKAQVSFFDTL